MFATKSRVRLTQAPKRFVMLARCEQLRRICFVPRDELCVPGATKDLGNDRMVVATDRPSMNSLTAYRGGRATVKAACANGSANRPARALRDTWVRKSRRRNR